MARCPTTVEPGSPREGSLTEVVEHQGGQHEIEPGQLYRALAEMSHVGVKGPGADDSQRHRAQREKRVGKIVQEEIHPASRIQRHQHGRMAGDAEDAQAGDAQ